MSESHEVQRATLTDAIERVKKRHIGYLDGGGPDHACPDEVHHMALLFAEDVLSEIRDTLYPEARCPFDGKPHDFLHLDSDKRICCSRCGEQMGRKATS